MPINEVRVYTPQGKLKQVISPEELERRSDEIAQGKLKLERRSISSSSNASGIFLLKRRKPKPKSNG